MTRATWICVGTGGVGKTTIAAALATAIAATGRTTVVATVDPARRLGHTLGLPVLATRTAVVGAPGLSAVAPDAVADVHALVERWLADQPTHAARLVGNPLLAILAGGFAGIHELVALVSLADLASDPACEALVIDTAPARHGLDLLALPARLAEVIDGRALAWAGELAKIAVTPGGALRGRLARWGQRRLVAAFSSAIGEAPIAAALALLAFAADLRPELSRLAASAGALLAPAAVRIAVVTAARPGAVDEVEQMRAALLASGYEPDLVVINRAPTGSTRTLSRLPQASAELRALATCAAAELDAARAAASAVAVRARETWRIPTIEIPSLSPEDPRAVVTEVARLLTAVAAVPQAPTAHHV